MWRHVEQSAEEALCHEMQEHSRQDSECWWAGSESTQTSVGTNKLQQIRVIISTKSCNLLLLILVFYHSLLTVSTSLTCAPHHRCVHHINDVCTTSTMCAPHHRCVHHTTDVCTTPQMCAPHHRCVHHTTPVCTTPPMCALCSKKTNM